MIDDIYAQWEALQERGLCGACKQREHECLCDKWCGLCGGISNHRTAQHAAVLEDSDDES